MYNIGYSLQVAVFQATQASDEEQGQFYQRLLEFVNEPSQILLIDETHKSRNASRRRRGWGKRGQTPVLSAYFAEDFLK